MLKPRLNRSIKNYLLADGFEFPVAAGSLNGSDATVPSGCSVIGTVKNTRTVVDTNSKISISSGVLSFATGEVANDAVWYPSVARLAGRVLFGRIIASETTNGIPAFGWDSAASGAILDHIRFGASAALQVVINGATALSIGTYAAASYDIAVVMRATGLFWFIKGGAFTLWTLLFMTGAGSAAGFPAIGAANTTAVFTADNVVIPAQLWRPAPLASDSFTRADGALGTTDGLGHAELNGGSGLAWTFDAGVWTIATNKAVGTPTQGAEILADPGLEGTYTAGLVAELVKVGSPTVAQSADAHGGSKAQSFASTGTNQYVGTTHARYTLSTGAWYAMSLWGKMDVAGLQSIPISLVQGWSTTGYLLIFNSGTYSARRRISRCTNGAAYQLAWLFSQGAGGQTDIIDDLSLKALTLSSLFATINASTPNVKVRATVAALTSFTQAGLVARLDSAVSPANFVIAYFDGSGNVKIDECVAGVYTNLATVAKAFTAADTLELDLSGTAYRLYHVTSGGTHTLIASGTVTTSTGNLHGLFSTYASNTFSGFTCWAKGNEGQWEGLGGLF
jgi:hypothetical protein